jgi:monoamine oxidase
MNHMMGCAGLFADDIDGIHFRRLQSPLERHYMIGDQISYHPGWQEGAIRSAHFAIADIDARVQAELQTGTPA